MKITAAIWDNVEKMFSELIDLPAPKRSIYLDQIHATQPGFYQLLIALLQQDENIHPLLARSASEIMESWQEDATLTGEHIGIYKLTHHIGQGAMGSVFLAERDDGEFQQSVALKLMKPGIYHEDILRLFREERQMLAGLQHPHIARLYDGGVSHDGRPFFTMEFVEGIPITDYCFQHPLSLHKRLRLFLQVCEAIQYAHSRLIAHLDLKPGNILVDQEGQTKLLDFGISKMLSQPSSAPPANAEHNANIAPQRFTLAYAAPEQLNSGEVSISSDIYALGAILYELVTGKHPFHQQLTDSSLLRQAILEDKPQAFSVYQKPISSGLKARELEAICFCAMEKNVQERYSSVEAMMRDIDALMHNYPVMASGKTKTYILSKFIQRNKRILSAIALAFILLAGTIGYYTQKVARERDLAQKEADKSAEITSLLTQIFKMADPNEANGDTITAVHLLNSGVKNMAVSLQNQPELMASLLQEISGIYLGLGSYPQADSLARRALLLTDSIFKSPHAEIARSLMIVSQVENTTGQLDSALAHIQASLRMYKALGSPQDPEITEALTEMSTIYYNRSGYALSDSVNQIVYAKHVALYQPPHPVLANDLQIIGTTKRKLGYYTEAEQYLTQSLQMKRALYEEPHAEIAYTLNHLASLKQDIGQFEEALPYARASFEQRKEIFGPGHIETLASQSNLARIYSHLNQLDEAEALYKEVLERMRAVFGENHYYVAAITQSLASIYLEKDELTNAETLYREAYLLDQKLLPAGDMKRSFALLGLGKTLMKKKQYAEAAEYLREALVLREKKLSAGHDLVGVCQQALGECLLAMKDYTTTIDLLEKAYHALAKMPEKYEENVSLILQQLITACLQNGEQEKMMYYQHLLNQL